MQELLHFVPSGDEFLIVLPRPGEIKKSECFLTPNDVFTL